MTISARITCPHCWHEYAPEESFYVAEHPDLDSDERLGEGHAQRFLPSRFTPDGDAIDNFGMRTNRLACPNCHLEVARSMYQVPSLFFSILGGSASGKSYFLAAMSWLLRKVLPTQFKVTITDSDPGCNTRLHEYEELLFLNPAPNEFISVAKTPEDGDLYDQVTFGSKSFRFPKPFLFSLQPAHKHPKRKEVNKYSRIVCLYDNAGESFLPGNDHTRAPVTRHLALSRCLFFLFDPTQDPRFRTRCEGKSDDPQMRPRSVRFARENSVRQDTILLEAIQRVRRHAGLRDDTLHLRPMVIVVTKWDSWKNLLPEILEDGELPPPPFHQNPDGSTAFLDGSRIKYVSKCLENLFRDVAPEIVAAAEGFARPLLFLPASGLGHSPTPAEDGNNFIVRPVDIEPAWVEVPMLYALHLCCPDLIGWVDQ